MVLIGKKEFAHARDNGFVCKDPFTRTSHGRTYAVSDRDYSAMTKYMNDKFKVTKY